MIAQEKQFTFETQHDVSPPPYFPREEDNDISFNGDIITNEAHNNHSLPASTNHATCDNNSTIDRATIRTQQAVPSAPPLWTRCVRRKQNDT